MVSAIIVEAAHLAEQVLVASSMPNTLQINFTGFIIVRMMICLYAKLVIYCRVCVFNSFSNMPIRLSHGSFLFISVTCMLSVGV